MSGRTRPTLITSGFTSGISAIQHEAFIPFYSIGVSTIVQ